MISGPVNGTLIMGQYLDNEITDFISSSVGYPVNLYNIYESDTKKYEKIIENLTTSKDPNKNIEIQYLGDNQISGYSIIKDIYGNPILLLQILLPRDIYLEGVKHINEFLIFTISYCFLKLFINLYYSQKNNTVTNCEFKYPDNQYWEKQRFC